MYIYFVYIVVSFLLQPLGQVMFVLRIRSQLVAVQQLCVSEAHLIHDQEAIYQAFQAWKTNWSTFKSTARFKLFNLGQLKASNMLANSNK